MPEKTIDVPRSLERGLTILEMIARQPDGVRYGEFTDTMQLPNTTVSRLLQSLIDLDYIAKNADGLYLPGKKMHRFSLGESTEDALRRIAAQPMRQLAEECNNSTALLHWTGEHAIFLERELVDGSLVFQKPGYVILYLHNTPWGIFCAGQDKMLNIDRPGPDFGTPAEHKKWVQHESRRLKEEGYCQGKFIDRRRIAAPIYGDDGKVIGALTLGGTHHSLNDQAIEKYAPILADLARACSERLR